MIMSKLFLVSVTKKLDHLNEALSQDHADDVP